MMNHILISGAGMAGLALARALKKQNIAYTLIEKNKALSTQGTGIALPANAVRALRHMGLSHTLSDMHQVKKVIYARANGRVLSEASLLEKPLGMDKFVALERKKLLHILADGLSDEIIFDTSIKHVTQTNTGVQVEFSNPVFDGEYTAVIGADGLFSTVRERGFDARDLVDLGVTHWRWITEYPTQGVEPTYMLGRRNVFLAYPMGRNHMYCYAHQVDKHQHYADANDAQTNLSHLFSGYAGIAGSLLNQLPPARAIYTGRLRSVPAPLFSDGRLALIGDAGNACSPMLQQGAASAFEDAIVLAQCLSKLPVKEALLRYEAIRKARVDWIVKTSDDAIKSFVRGGSKWSEMLRNLVIRQKGPLNVLGWRQLLLHSPLEEEILQ